MITKNAPSIQELEQQHAEITMAPLTDDPSCSYIIKFEQAGVTEYWGVASFEEALNSAQEHPFSTATIHIKNQIPTIDL